MRPGAREDMSWMRYRLGLDATVTTNHFSQELTRKSPFFYGQFLGAKKCVTSQNKHRFTAGLFF